MSRMPDHEGRSAHSEAPFCVFCGEEAARDAGGNLP